ncbi:hypothetical protein ACQ4PT_005609 [Festuca glaucescens]
MVSKSQAQTEVLAADCARLEAADRVQRESWEVARRLQRSVDELQAAAREKDAEMDMLRSEAADARKKLQADATRKMTWEAAYVELLLGANQKLAELRDSDLEDSRTCAETPNSKEVGRRAKLNQDAVDHIASDLSADLRKLKQAYETLSSKKDKEVSALLSEKDSVRNQLDIMQQDYAKLLKNKEVEAAQATEAALKLQKSVDELKVLAQKKDVEIDRLQAEAVEAKKNHDKDLCALVSEKDCVHNQLSIMQQDYTKLLKNKEVLTQKKDHEIVILRAEAIGAKMKVQKMHSLVKEKDAEIQRLKGWHVESVQKHYKDMSETHKKSRSVDPAVTRRDKLKNSNRRQTVEEDYISETKTVEKDGQEETTQKRRRASSMSNDCEMSGSDQDSDEQSESDEDGDKQSERDEDGDTQTSDENSDEQSRSGGDDDHDGQSRSDEHDEDEHSQSGSDKETTNNLILKLPGNHKRKRDACNAESANGKSHSERNLISYLARSMKDVLDGQPELIRRFNVFLPIHCQIELEKPEDDDGEQSGGDEDDGEQSGSDEDGDEQSGSGEGDDDNEKRSGSDNETTHNERKGDAMAWEQYRWWRAPAPLRQRKMNICNGRRSLDITGHWGQYVKAVNDSLVDQPDKHKKFVWFLRNFRSWRVRYVARTMEVILDGQPKLIRQFNCFLPNNCQIEVDDDDDDDDDDDAEEKQQPEQEQPV